MASVRSVVFDIIGRDNFSSAATKAATSAAAAATSMEKSLLRVQSFGAKTAALGKSMSTAITLPVLAAAAVSIKEASDFQKAQVLLQTAGGETEAKMTVISKGIKTLAIQTGTSLEQLNAGMYTVAKFGNKFSATDQLLILKAAAEGAKAENVDLGIATQGLTTVMQSYGAKASDAIRIQNELVVAAGRAKTTTSDFIDSLSSVIPLASSLGISLAQVTGAIDTMTQHGETAQQATDNLNNLIRNLAGQNNVAAAAMSQLGIKTLDLRKNLAQNGLTGTLQIVENALAKNSKGGLVVVSAFKQAALATQSLHQMLGTMTGDLAKQSAGLLKGSVGIKDYRSYAQSLGGTAGAAALQFLTLYKASNGFSDALKSGNSTVSTSAQQLQKMLGGATGLNVALMLSGNSAAAFKSNVADISAAANKTGTDISTWAKTQSTLAVKSDQAREKLQVLAVNLGTQLIPIATKVVGVLSGAVTWFSNLSKGTQQFIIKAGLLLAVLGPLLSVVGRLVSTGAALARWAVAGVVAMARFAAGVRGAEISLTGMQTKAYSAGLSIRSSMLRAGESSTFTPLSAGIAAVSAALIIGIQWWNSYENSQRAAKARVDDLTQSILADNNAVGQSSRALVVQQLSSNGMLQALAKAGFDPKVVTDAVISGGKQLADLDAKIKSSIGLITYGTGKGGQPAIHQAHDIISALGSETSALGKAAAAARVQAQAIGGTGTESAAGAAKNAATQTAAFGTALGKANTALSAQASQQAFTAGLANLSDQTKTATANIADQGGAALSTMDKLKNLAQSALDTASAQQRNGDTALTVAQNLQTNINALEAQAEKLGVSKAAVDSLIASMNLTPSQIDTYFNVDIAQAVANIGRLQQLLAGLGGAGDAESRAEGTKVAGQLGSAQAALAASLRAAAASATHTSTSSGGQPKISGGSAGGGGSSASKTKFDTATLTSFLKALSGTYDDVSQAFQSIVTSAKNAGKSFSSGLFGEDKTLLAEVSKRNNIAAALSKANQNLATAVTAYNDYRSSVSSAVSGSFDVAQVQSQYADQGTSTSTIITALRTAVSNAARFSTVIKALVAKRVAPGLIKQLLAAGPASLPQAQALLSASYSQLAEINADYGNLGATANDLGTVAANDFYGAGVKSAQGIVAGLKSQEGQVAAAVQRLAAVMVAQMKKTLGIHSPSRVFHELGVHTGQGFTLGVQSQHPAARKAVDGLTNHGTPRSQWGQGHVIHGTYIDKQIVVHEAVTPYATANAVIARQQHRSRA